MTRGSKTILCSKHARDEGILWPDEIFFFDNKLTLSLHESPAPEPRGNYFYQAMHPSNGSDYNALQLVLLVGILFAVCDSEDQNQKGRFPTFNLYSFLKSEDVITGPERFSPGQGLWSEKEWGNERHITRQINMDR